MMGKAIFRVFDVGAGDCIFLELTNENESYVIMVDCGILTEEVKDYVCNHLNNHINLLIATHIDADHILGLRDLLTQTSGLKIDKILYNCGQSVEMRTPKQLPESVTEDLQTLNLQTTNKTSEISEQNISAHQALTLAQAITANEGFRNAWITQNEYITDKTENLSLGEKFGELVFLSPTSQDLTNLDAKFKKAFFDKFYRLYEGPYPEDASLFEILISQLPKPYESGDITIASTLCTPQSIKNIATKDDPTTISPSNKASIAFLWRCREKQVLFCGDANPLTIVTRFLSKSESNTGMNMFEVIKVPHHGSSHNCGSQFWDFFDSSHIFITGYDEHKRPSKECLCKIVNRTSSSIREIHYTRKNNALTWLGYDPTIAQTFNFILSNSLSYEFEY